MSDARLNILLVAEEAAGIHVLRAIRDTPHRIAAVLTSEPATGRAGATVWETAQQAGVDVWPAAAATEAGTAARIRDAGVDLLLNVHSLRIVHPAVLEAPRIGAYNLHPSLLPRYAGLNSVSWAIYRGETEHGVTLHRMSPQVDAGPIAYQRAFAVAPCDTALAVFTRCARSGVELVMQLVATAAEAPDRIPAREQDPARRELFRRADRPYNGCVVWARPAHEIVNFARACNFDPFPSPWGHPRFVADGRVLRLHRARRTNQPALAPPGTVEAIAAGGARVACGDESIVLEDYRDGSGAAAGSLRAGLRLADGEGAAEA